MGTLSIIMMNLRMELLQKYGKNNIYLREVMNTDRVLMIFYGGGKHHGHSVGQVELTDTIGWVLVDFQYETFEAAIKFEEELAEIGVVG